MYPLLINVDYEIVEKNKKNFELFFATLISNVHYSDQFLLIIIKDLVKYRTTDMGDKYHNNVCLRVND